MKRKLAMLLALTLLLGASGCKSSKNNNSATESYIIIYEDVDNPAASGSSGTSSNGSGTSGSGTSGSSGGSANTGTGGSGAAATKPVQTKGTISNLDFGGQTFTKTIIGTAPAYKIRLKEAFEKKFNCKIKFVNLPWESYNSKVASAMAAGQPYDICGLHFYFWPEAGVQNLYAPIDEYLYEQDLYDPNSGSTAGIDLDQCRYYSWNGKTYGIANNRNTYCGQPDVYYYNKTMVKGFEDPMELYLKGEWTWDKFFEIAEIVTKGGKVKMFGDDWDLGSFAQRDGILSTKTVNGKVTTNLDDPLWTKAVKTGAEFFAKYCERIGGRSDPTPFLNGQTFMKQHEITWGTFDGYDLIVKSSAFKNNYDNLGIVPIPKGPNNTNDIYVKAAPQAKAAGNGSKDPRVAVAWVWFASQWEDPLGEDDPALYSSDVYNMLDKVYKSTYYGMPNYKTSTQKVMDLTSEIFTNTKYGDGDFTKLVADRITTIQSIIDDSLKQ